jgi:hypothetical protein
LLSRFIAFSAPPASSPTRGLAHSPFRLDRRFA